MKILLALLLSLTLLACSGCLGGSASANNSGARANLNLGGSF